MTKCDKYNICSCSIHQPFTNQQTSFRKIDGIPDGTYCAPLITALYLYMTMCHNAGTNFVDF